MVAATNPLEGLPDPALLHTAATSGTEEDCQRYMLVALEHGTASSSSKTNTNNTANTANTNKANNANTNNPNHNQNQNHGEDSLSARIQDTVKWFETGLGFLQDEEPPTKKCVTDALVDCLWLMGSTLTALEWKPPPEVASGTHRAFHPSVRALIVIVRALLASPFFAAGQQHTPEANNAGEMKTKTKTSASASGSGSATNGASGSGSSLARKLQENWFPILLEAVEVVRVAPNQSSSGSADDLMKRLKQHNTASNYKQQKYNLLQEESEGYSKLLQHLCHEHGSSSDSDSASDNDSDSDNSKNDKHDSASDPPKPNLASFWQLVGTFELDPNRVLDLALDVLECTIATPPSKTKTKTISPPVLSSHASWLLEVVRESPRDKLPALLRFKLRSSSDARNAVSYQSLLETIALLVQQDLLDLSVFVHDYFDTGSLARDLNAAYGVFRTKERDRVVALSRVSLSGNSGGNPHETPKQLELAGRLRTATEKLGTILDDARGVTKNAAASKDAAAENNKNSKSNTNSNNNSSSSVDNGHVLSLWLVLIRWGEWNKVAPLLPPLTWSKVCCLLPKTFGSALIDCAEGHVSKLTADKVSNNNNRHCQTPVLTKHDESATATTTTTTTAATKVECTSRETEASETVVLRLVRSVSDPLSHVVQSGCIASRPIFFCKLCRLLRSLLADCAVFNDDKGSSHQPAVGCVSNLPSDVFFFLNRVLVPSLSLFQSNPSLSTELWSVLSVLPYDIRYKLYEGWKGSGLEKAGLMQARDGTTKPLPNVEAETVAGKAARYSLKRLSKDNIRDMSRQLAKVTHSNPLVVFATILSQIESYDNMVEVMVEALRFVNPLGLDVLGHCVLGRLSGTSGGMINRNRLKEDGVNVSQWLQSLETFAGEFYKARPFVEFRGILYYLIGRLKVGNVMELGMLRTLLKVAGGYSFADYSPAASLNETQLDGRSGSVALQRETMSFGIVENTNSVACSCVRNVLQTDGLGVSLLILIAQARDRIIFDSGKGAFKDVKLVGNLHDTCQVVMSILLEFLTNQEDAKDSSGKNASTGSNDNVTVYSKFLPSLQDLQNLYGLDMATIWLLCRPSVKSALKMERKELELSSLKRFELSEEVRKAYTGSLPESVWSVLTPKLFEFFYMNVLGDIYCPERVFMSEISRINEEVERLEGVKHSFSKNAATEIERLKGVSKQLDLDMKQQKEHVESTLKELNDEKDHFFTTEFITQEGAKTFLMYCIYPRAILGPDDAMYASAIAFRLHKIWTPGFSIMHYIDELISIVSGALFGLTEAEAANISILIWQTLKVVNKWRFEDGLYDKEVLGKPGSSVESTDNGEKSTNPVSHKEFIELYNKWQYSLADALIGCLKSSQYIHTRTGLVVLSRLVEVFPTGPSLGNKLLKFLEPLQDESSSRPDIRASANAYGMMLLKARDEGKWVEEDEADAKARADKEKQAAKERKKKIEKSFQELERDNQKITERIGAEDRRDRERSRGGGARDTYNSRQAGGGGRDDYSRTENGRDRRGDERRGDDRDRRSTGREEDWKKRDRDEDSTRDDRGRGGRRSGGDDDRRVSSRDTGDLPPRGGRDEGRWRRDREALPLRNAKRSRASASPEDDRDAASKRPRTEEYNNYPSRRAGTTRSRSPQPPSSRTTRSSRRGMDRR